MTPEELADEVDGVVVWRVALSDVPSVTSTRKAYAAMKSMAIWSSNKSNVEIPEEVKEHLRWMRDNFGEPRARRPWEAKPDGDSDSR